MTMTIKSEDKERVYEMVAGAWSSLLYGHDADECYIQPEDVPRMLGILYMADERQSHYEETQEIIKRLRDTFRERPGYEGTD